MSDDATRKRVSEARAASNNPSIPRWLRDRINLGIRRAERLRAAIATDARVPTMPAAQAVNEVWLAKGEVILGRTGLIERAEGADLCVLLPAPSLAQSDDELLRAVLAREFQLCFRLWVGLALAEQKRSSRPGLDPRRRQTAKPDPLHWLGADDAERVTSWPSELPLAGMQVIAGLLMKVLPTAEPPRVPESSAVRVPGWVLDYASGPGDRKLRTGRSMNAHE